jgi:hypothetical protein
MCRPTREQLTTPKTCESGRCYGEDGNVLFLLRYATVPNLEASYPVSKFSLSPHQSDDFICQRARGLFHAGAVCEW